MSPQYVIKDKASDIDLEIRQGSDFKFDVKWWANKEKTVQVVVTGATSELRGSLGGDLILNVNTYITVTGGGTIQVRIPAAITRTIPVTTGVWQLSATSATETRVLMAGNFKVLQKVAPGA